MLVFEANNLMEEDGKKTMTIEHLLQAFSDLGYPEYIELLKEKAEEFNATHQIKVKRKKKLVRDFTMSAEGLLAEQERLFNVSRERFESVTEMELVAGESGFYISAMIQDEEVELQCHSSEM